MTELPGQIANTFVENYSGLEKLVGLNCCCLCYFTFPEVATGPQFVTVSDQGGQLWI